MLLNILLACLVCSSIPGVLMQREDIVAGVILAQAADSVNTILDGEQRDTAADVCGRRHANCHSVYGPSQAVAIKCNQTNACWRLWIKVCAAPHSPALPPPLCAYACAAGSNLVTSLTQPTAPVTRLPQCQQSGIFTSAGGFPDNFGALSAEAQVSHPINIAMMQVSSRCGGQKR
jgi:hypothetical protein